MPAENGQSGSASYRTFLLAPLNGGIAVLNGRGEFLLLLHLGEGRLRLA
jgi:hypothetical protein